MSVVEDVRQALQDFVAPEMRAFNARLDSLENKIDNKIEILKSQMNSRFEAQESRSGAFEERMNSRFEVVETKLSALEQKNDTRFTAMEQKIISMEEKADTRFAAMEQKMEMRHLEVLDKIEGLKNALLIDKRLERLERIESQRAGDPLVRSA